MENETNITVSEKNSEYVVYINQHIENVRLGFDTHAEELCEILGVDIDILLELVENHDVSKFDPYEFVGYQQYFYPVDPESKKDPVVIKNFGIAWCLHKNNNPHHPEFWCNVEDNKIVYLDMPAQYIAEMLLDWDAMGKVYGDTVYEYYKKEGNKKPFSVNTRKLVESCIDIFK